MSLIGYYPYRCRQCDYRFMQFRYAVPGAPPGAPSSAEREIRTARVHTKRRRKMREFVLYGIGLLLFLGFLYYITRPDLGN